MPTTVTVSDPRYRTKSININLDDPNKYVVTIKREIVKDVEETGKLYSREEGITMIEEIHFDGGVTPRGNQILLELLLPIQTAIAQLAAEYNEDGSNVFIPPSNSTDQYGTFSPPPEEQL